MRIVSLILRLKSDAFAATREALARIPGVELAHEDAEGCRQIITIEDGPDHSTADAIVAVHQIPTLMSVTLAYEYSDDNTQETMPCP